MVAIIHQTDKRSDLTYAYESISHYDKEKRQSRCKRRLIGRVDKETGKIIPTDGRGRKRSPYYQQLMESAPSNGEIPSDDMSFIPGSTRLFYGATYLLDAIGDKLGVTADLKRCFPKSYKQILSLVYYLILEDKNSLYRFEKWGLIHKHPYGKDIPSQRSSEIFASITEDDKNRFFGLWGKNKAETEYLAYDITSISSFSEALRQVQYGNNKEHDLLPQLHLALVYGQKSRIPLYYRKLAGNIPDSKTVKNLIADLAILGFSKVKLVMDRGFYSESNINNLYKEHLKFLIGVKISYAFVKKELDLIYDDFRSYDHFSEKYDLYSHTVQTEWTYTQERPYKGDLIEEKRRVYIQYYFNIDRAAEEEKKFDRALISLRRELESGKRVPEHERAYTKYFETKTTPKRGIQVMVKQEAVKKAKRYFGYFALLTNEKMESEKALEIYRGKDVIEKAFGNIKERLDMRRVRVSSEQTIDGKLFVEFIALIYLAYIKKQMEEKGLCKTYTLQGILDKLDVIECFEMPGRKIRVGEILEKQKKLYIDLGVAPPS